MPASEKTYYRLSRLHRLFALAGVLLLAATVWMIVVDQRRPWREYQRQYRGMAAVDGRTAPAGVQQYWLPGLPLDYHFQQVARSDRCTTCHLGMTAVGAASATMSLAPAPGSSTDRARPAALPQPFQSHPRLDLFVAESSPHPASAFGCTICHDGQGSATEFTWASHMPNSLAAAADWQRELGWSENPNWFQPMLPARFAQSRCLTCHREVTDLAATPAGQQAADKLLAGYELIRRAGCYGCHEIQGYDAEGRATGPDLRLEPPIPMVASASAAGSGEIASQAVASQAIDAAAAVVETRRPPGAMRRLGPSLREIGQRLDMAVLVDRIATPQHLLPAGRMPSVFGVWSHLSPEAAEKAALIEPAEVRAIATYLLAQGDAAGAATLDWTAPTQPVDRVALAPEAVERGRQLFARHGCLACHQHADFPAGVATQGPDLTDVGAKYRAAGARQWLVRWLSDPPAVMPRTLMPQPLFDQPTTEIDDLAAFLLASRQAIGAAGPWEPNPLPDVSPNHAAAQSVVEQYLADDGRSLLWPSSGVSQEQFIETGRRAILRRGCTACHEIPGLEQAPMIGPTLTGWGRKPPELLGFEKVAALLARESSSAAHSDSADANPPESSADDAAFFRRAIEERRREGFLWQKLRAPRSFDFDLAAAKPYRQWLTMPQFRFTPAEREAAMTFVLGLVPDEPAARYLPRYDDRARAALAGGRWQQQFACAECHTMAMDRWTIRYRPGAFPAPPAAAEYPFMQAAVTAEALAASSRADADGYAQTTLVGRPRCDAQGRLIEDEDDDGNVIHYFTLWEAAALDGHRWPTGGAEVVVPAEDIVAQTPAVGGAYARLLYPLVVSDARAQGATASEREAWGWTPPPLAYEGTRVQPPWITSYLLDPTRIRPAVALRMPRYAMTSDEAAQLTEYLCALPQRRYAVAVPPLPRAADSPSQNRQRDLAMRLITDRTNYCAKCHLIGDYSPGPSSRTVLAPNLQNVETRIQGDALRRWLAHPQAILPYTAMPVNFPPGGPPLSTTAFPASTGEQLDAVSDLLLHYKEYLGHLVPVRPLVERDGEHRAP